MLTELEFNNDRALSSRYNGYGDYVDQINEMDTTQGSNAQDGNKFNFMDYLPFGNKSISGSIMRGIGNFMPERDPRQTALNEFYDVNNGTIQSGLMKDYNPVSGGFLNTVTGGKFGDPINYGLQNAYQKRMDTINKTLQRKYSKRNYGDTQLDERLKTLRGMRDDEQKFVADQIGQNYTGDQDMQNVVDDTGRRDATSGAGITAQDQFSNKTGRGRTDYFFGGRARLQGGGGADMGAPEKAAERASKGYGTAPDTGSKSGTNDYSTTTQTQNNDRSIRDNQNPVPKESILNRTMDLGSELSYLNNLKNLNVLGIVGNIGVNKFRNYMKNKNLPEEDKFSYNTNPLPTNNYFAEVQQKDLDASKMRGFKKQDYNSYLDQMNMLNDGTKVTPYEFKGLQDGSITTTGTFTAANGGRAMFKNGGLASIL